MRFNFKELAKNIAVFLITVAILCAGMEVTYRLIKKNHYFYAQGIFENHPTLGFRLTPAASGKAGGSEYVFDMKINSQGLRDIERASHEKPAGTFRILGLGDSFAMGQGVEYEEMFYTKLEQSLQAKYGAGKVDVIKAGIGGWGPRQEAIFLQEEGLKYKPDIVLLAFFENDFANEKNSEIGPGPYVQNGYLMPPPPEKFAWNHFIFGHMRSWGYLKAKIRALPFFARNAKESGTIHFEVDSTQLKPKNPETERVIANTFNLVEKIHQAAKEGGARFVVVAIPGSYRVDPALRKELSDKYGFKPEETDYLRPYKQLEEFGREYGFEVLNLGPIIEKYPGHVSGDLYFPIDTHFTRGGHALAAEAIFRYFEENGLIQIK